MIPNLDGVRGEAAASGASSRRRPESLLLLVALLLAAFLGCRAAAPRFPHRQHLGLACGDPGQPKCLTCVSCHNDIVVGREEGHPTGDDCRECHQKDAHRVERSLALAPTAAHQSANRIRFEHQPHLAMPEVGGQCISCHAGVVSDRGGAPFPQMARCFECHEHQEQWDQGTCAPCHDSADLRRTFPETFLRHGPGWDKQHGAEASLTTKQCAACHTSESCDDCHDVTQGLEIEVRQASRVEKDFIHPADFLTRHAMEAASEPARCLTCHRAETCDSCHIERGISAARADAINPHPPGWVGPDSSRPNHHGYAARREIVSCAGCHDQGPLTNCITCHKVGGIGGNPHPDGWRSSRTPSDVMCNYCHGGP